MATVSSLSNRDARAQSGKPDPAQERNEQLRRLVFGLSFFTLVPVAAVLIGAAVGFWIAAIEKRNHMLALSLGALTTTAGIFAVVICLLLRLREYKDEEVPPALTGPLVVVALGTALTLGVLFGN